MLRAKSGPSPRAGSRDIGPAPRSLLCVRPCGRREQARASGSIPRARGAVLYVHVEAHRHGSVPACAESRDPWSGSRQPWWVHPGMRGKQCAWRAAARAQPGTYVESIPACAGAVAFGDRAGGVLGSIPAARAAAHLGRQKRAARGSTPRGACPDTARACGVHPRVRGEQRASASESATGQGPSPRARATADDVAGLGRVLGSIPACAGSRRPSPRFSGCRWVHPRVRGQQSCSTWSPVSALGPSPRTRGAVSLTCAFSERGPRSEQLSKNQTFPPRLTRHQRQRTHTRPRRGIKATSLHVSPLGAGSRATRDRRSPSTGAHPCMRREQVHAEAPSCFDPGPSRTGGEHTAIPALTISMVGPPQARD